MVEWYYVMLAFFVGLALGGVWAHYDIVVRRNRNYFRDAGVR